MLCLNKEQLLKKVDLKELKDYMLYNLKDDKTISCSNLSFVESKSIEESNDFSKSYIPRSQIQVNYTKKYSKYNEPNKINNNKRFSDKLFWLFYKIINNFDDSDLQDINTLKIMKDFKFNIVEKIKSQKNVLKDFKIQRSLV